MRFASDQHDERTCQICRPQYYGVPKAPYCCPVCDGRGTVPPGFYSGQTTFGNDISPLPCRACDGAGVLWK